MDFMATAFSIFISAYQHIFLFIAETIGNYGVSIILLSILTSIALISLIKLSNKIVIKETEYQNILTPKIESIKQRSTGEKQHKLIKKLYQKYNYSPFYAVKKLSNLFIQLPFLFLTYYMLDGLTELSGIPFIFINDLNQPDGLLAGINILPFAMVAFNMLAAITTPNFTKKDLSQASIITAIFLVILYNLSAALLLYWTFNSAILMVKNIYAFMKAPQSKIKLTLPQAMQFIKQVIFNKYTITTTAFIAITLVLNNDLIFSGKSSSAKAILAFIFTSPMYAWIYYTAVKKLPVKTVNELTCKDTNVIITAFLSLCSYLVFIDSPLSLYINSPEDFYGVEFFDVAALFVSMFVISILFYIALVKLTSNRLKLYLLPISVFLALVMFSYNKLITPSYGLLHNFSFDIPENIIQNYAISALETIILACLLIVIVKHIQSIQKHLKLALILMLAICFITTANGAFTNSSPQIITEDNKEISDLNVDDFSMTMSKEPNNVLIVLLDGFSAGHIPLIMQDDSSIDKGFKDFTWYKNTLSTSGGTVGTLPSLLAGHKFTADEIIKRDSPPLPIGELMIKAYKLLPEEFSKKGYKTSVINTMYNSDTQSINADTYAFKADKTNNNLGDTTGYVKKVLSMLSIFRSTPLFMRDFIYNGGSWRIIKSNMYSYKEKLAHFNLLTRLANEAPKISIEPSYTYIHVSIPHAPNIVTKNGIGTLEEGGEYFYDAKYALKQLDGIFNSMKAVGVYDNTQIVIISDHGYWVENTMFSDSFVENIGAGFQQRRSPGFVHALLMVKDPFKQNSKMIESDLFMSNSDLPSIVCTSIGSCEGIDKSPIINPTKRSLIFNLIDLNILSKHGTYKEFVQEQWIVNDNIFSEKNWHKLN